jgi:POT family proton-dependent oligopeptide transporter
MLFMTEFWERFAFYGIRWALTLYIVQQFYAGSGEGEAPASRIYGAYLALVYAAAIFGGYVADRILGYQRSILLGAVVMAAGLFMIAYPDEQVFKLGLATVIAGNGLFKPNISTMVGKLYSPTDERRDSGFTLFYMGINAGAFFAPLLTGWLAAKGVRHRRNAEYKIVFMPRASACWSAWCGSGSAAASWKASAVRRKKAPPASARCCTCWIAAIVAIPVHLLPAAHRRRPLAVGAHRDVHRPVRDDPRRRLPRRPGAARPRDRDAADLPVQRAVLVLLRAGRQLVQLPRREDRRPRDVRVDVPGGLVPVGELAGDHHARADHRVDVDQDGPANPSIPRKFGLGIIFNGLAFLLLMARAVGHGRCGRQDPVLDALHGLRHPVGGRAVPVADRLSMTTKLAPVKLVGFAMGGWFLSTGIGNNLSGIFASHVSGATGMTVDSANAGYTQGFIILMIGGVALFLIAPLIQKLMHGVK